jgi:hypothetical protein
MYVCMYSIDELLRLELQYVCTWIEYQVVSKILDATMQALWRLHLPSWFVALAGSGREAVVEDAAAAAVAASAKDNCSALASASSSSNSSLVGAEEGGAGTSLAPPLLLLEILCDCDCADPEPALEVPMLSKAFNLASRVF